MRQVLDCGSPAHSMRFAFLYWGVHSRASTWSACASAPLWILSPLAQVITLSNIQPRAICRFLLFIPAENLTSALHDTPRRTSADPKTPCNLLWQLRQKVA